MKFVAPVFTGSHAESHVRFQLLEQAVAELPAGDVSSSLADERRIVDAKDHVQSRLVDEDGGQRLGVIEVGNRIADVHVFQADDGANVAGCDLVCFRST